MKLKDFILKYFNDLPNRWSANFLAFLGAVNFIFVLISALITTIYEVRSTMTITNFIEFIKFYINVIFSYSIELFPVTCYLAVFIAIFYILLISSNKRYFVAINLIIMLSFFITIFAMGYKALDMTSGGAIFLAFTLLTNIIIVPISILIYLILLIIEHFSRFRVPENLVSKSFVYKKHIKIFYCYYFFLIFSMFIVGLHWIIT